MIHVMSRRGEPPILKNHDVTMRADVDLELERQSVLPGEEIRGRVTVTGVTSFKSLTLSLQGEEVLGAGSLVRSYVYPVLDEVRTFGAPMGAGDFVQPFSFRIPDTAPPSYASPDLRCQYFLKARLQLGGRMGLGRLGGDTIKRLHLTVLPSDEGAVPVVSRELVLEDGGLRLVAFLEDTAIRSGESLRGSLQLHRSSDDTELPSRLTFRLAAIEESLSSSYSHRQVLWVQTHDVEPSPYMDFPVQGLFEFPLPEDAPFSGDWTSFRIHYGFRVGMNLRGGRQIRESLPIEVHRRYAEPLR